MDDIGTDLLPPTYNSGMAARASSSTNLVPPTNNYGRTDPVASASGTNLVPPTNNNRMPIRLSSPPGSFRLPPSNDNRTSIRLSSPPGSFRVAPTNNNEITGPVLTPRPITTNQVPPTNNKRMAGPPPRRWLMDRIHGRSKFGDRERPWGPCCWVPPLVGWYPGFWEESKCCKVYGRMGAYSSEVSRFWCMHVGFVANLVACLFMAYSCFAMSQDYTLLSHASFGSITMTERDDKFPDEILLKIGLRAIALDNPLTGVDRAVVTFDTFCDISVDGLQRYMDPDNCSSCFDNSLNACISAILAVISFIPTFFTDILRMFSGYDVNCQKAFGTFFSLCTIGLALNVLFSWKFLCADTFYKNEIYLDDKGNRVFPDDPDREYTIEYEYTWGWALMAMLVGACFKFLEVMAHFCIPTPSITRVLKEQEVYEIIREENLVVEDQESPL